MEASVKCFSFLPWCMALESEIKGIIWQIKLYQASQINCHSPSPHIRSFYLLFWMVLEQKQRLTDTVFCIPRQLGMGWAIQYSAPPFKLRIKSLHPSPPSSFFKSLPSSFALQVYSFPILTVSLANLSFLSSLSNKAKSFVLEIWSSRNKICMCTETPIWPPSVKIKAQTGRMCWSGRGSPLFLPIYPLRFTVAKLRTSPCAHGFIPPTA